MLSQVTRLGTCDAFYHRGIQSISDKLNKFTFDFPHSVPLMDWRRRRVTVSCKCPMRWRNSVSSSVCRCTKTATRGSIAAWVVLLPHKICLSTAYSGVATGSGEGPFALSSLEERFKAKSKELVQVDSEGRNGS